MHGGQAMLKAIERSGVDFILSSPGSEWPPVWEALAEAAARGAQKPKYINCRHEAVAVAMAAGYTKVTNRPQVVMLHATAGPLNGAMTLRAALHERTPMVIISGEIAAYGENTKVADPGGQWLHDLTDLGGSPDLLRGCVKWADRISSAELLGPTIERAVRIAMEPPMGPVLIGIPFECMMEQVNDIDHGKANEVARAHAVDDVSIDKALSLIAVAKNPIALTEHVGGDPLAVERFVELCELFGIPVMETYRPAFMNFPRTHPLYLHHDPKAVDAADLILMVDAVTPWYPASKAPKNAKVIAIADEFPNSRLPYWGYNVDLALAAPPASTLGQLVKKAKASEQVAANRGSYEARAARTREQHDNYFGKLKEEAQKHSGDEPIDPRWAVQALGQALPANSVISEETTVYRGLIQEMIPRDQAQSYFARVTGGLGVGLSYALGVKLAMPDRPVFALIGDGAFHYNAVLLPGRRRGVRPADPLRDLQQRPLPVDGNQLDQIFPLARRKTPVSTSAPRSAPGRTISITPRPMAAKASGDQTEVKSRRRRASIEVREKKLTVIDLVLSDLNPR
jgi:acetolactate synthase-1/2/3 large subunit